MNGWARNSLKFKINEFNRCCWSWWSWDADDVATLRLLVEDDDDAVDHDVNMDIDYVYKIWELFWFTNFHFQAFDHSAIFTHILTYSLRSTVLPAHFQFNLDANDVLFWQLTDDKILKGKRNERIINYFITKRSSTAANSGWLQYRQPVERWIKAERLWFIEGSWISAQRGIWWWWWRE